MIDNELMPDPPHSHQHSLQSNASVFSLLKEIQSIAPVFAVDADQIEFIDSPSSFHQTIIDKISSAHGRVGLCSLYIGANESVQEQAFVQAISDRLEKPDSSDFRTLILMDKMRGCRGGSCSAASMLAPMVSSYSPNLQVFMYTAPCMRSSIWNWMIPERLNEIFGLLHMKILVFDNDVLITGANLSTAYFTNRADRYVVIRNCARLAEYYWTLLEVVSSFSYALEGVAIGDGRISFANQPRLHHSMACGLLQKFIDNYREESGDQSLDACSTMIVPTIQMAPFGIFQDQVVLQTICNWMHLHGNDAWTPSLSSAYFNPTSAFKSMMTGSNRRWRILTAASTCHGFHNAQGASSIIPNVYRSLLWRFLCEGQSRPKLAVHQEEELVFEYDRRDWSFHVKGVWFGSQSECNLLEVTRADDCNSFEVTRGDDCNLLEVTRADECGQVDVTHKQESFEATIIGSSNYGSRSFERDLESQLLIITCDDGLCQRIRRDQRDVFQYARATKRSDMEQCQGTTSRYTRLVAHLTQSYL